MVTGGRKPVQRTLAAGTNLWFGKKGHPQPALRSSLTGQFGYEEAGGCGCHPRKFLLLRAPYPADRKQMQLPWDSATADYGMSTLQGHLSDSQGFKGGPAFHPFPWAHGLLEVTYGTLSKEPQAAGLIFTCRPVGMVRSLR